MVSFDDYTVDITGAEIDPALRVLLLESGEIRERILRDPAIEVVARMDRNARYIRFVVEVLIDGKRHLPDWQTRPWQETVELDMAASPDRGANRSRRDASAGRAVREFSRLLRIHAVSGEQKPPPKRRGRRLGAIGLAVVFGFTAGGLSADLWMPTLSHYLGLSRTAINHTRMDCPAETAAVIEDGTAVQVPGAVGGADFDQHTMSVSGLEEQPPRVEPERATPAEVREALQRYFQ